jgi:hypothetical protein
LQGSCANAAAVERDNLDVYGWVVKAGGRGVGAAHLTAPPPPVAVGCRTLYVGVEAGNGFRVYGLAFNPHPLGCARHCVGTYMSGTKFFKAAGRDPPLDLNTASPVYLGPCCSLCYVAVAVCVVCRISRTEYTNFASKPDGAFVLGSQPAVQTLH